ncbi:MAG: ribulose-phosphate 3-epimerase [DPANN group archaeon]|nr:ribulose-phosphate 3-epimerase [DPANN group archaeon]
MKIQIIPSILSADFGHLQDEVDRVSSADSIQVDVMDGHFVPNISMGPAIQKSIRTKLPIETHLMVSNPEKFIDAFADAGSRRIIVHGEALEDPLPVFEMIHRRGCEAGLAINPDTPLTRITPYLDAVDMVLCMTVFPGFGGQSFIPSVLPKITELRKMFKKDIEVDGGINFETARRCVDAGANLLIVGSFLYRNEELTPQQVIAKFRERFP